MALGYIHSYSYLVERNDSESVTNILDDDKKLTMYLGRVYFRVFLSSANLEGIDGGVSIIFNGCGSCMWGVFRQGRLWYHLAYCEA